MVTVTRIDRLARSTFDLFAVVKQIVDAKAQFRSLAEPWADTDTGTGRLMIAVLGGLADVERDLIRSRTARPAAGHKSAGSAWKPKLTRPNRTRPAADAPKVLPSLSHQGCRRLQRLSKTSTQLDRFKHFSVPVFK
jgi:DNA invertase Pin-like site-specific DNA recombinase